jgi:hypothetical protein
MAGVWIPNSEVRDDFQLGLLGGQREEHGAMQQIWSEGLAVECALNILEGFAQVAHVELIPYEDFGSGRTQSIGTDIIAVRHSLRGADGRPCS